jgi:RNA polymerase sigma-70 factor, ECF subfamily
MVRAYVQIAEPDRAALNDALFERARTGDRGAQSAFLQEHYSYVHGFIARLLGPVPDVDDLCQAALMQTVRSLASFEGRSSLRTWLGAICVNVVKDHLRRERREGARRAALPAEGEVPSHEDSVRTLEQRQRLEIALACLQSVPDSQRIAFTLRAVYGHSVEEVAQLMGAAKSTTRLRLFYGRKRFLRAMLARGREVP